jgi:ABC-type iron transport system FetAB ATPase subunit
MQPQTSLDNPAAAISFAHQGLVVRNLRFRDRGPFSFDLAPGTCIGLSGPSGVGKSLLLRALADLDPHQGEVLLDGRPAAAFSAPQWRRQVGYLPATSHWWHEIVGDHFHGDWTPLVASSGLPADVGRWPVSRLSTGERQRLGILRLMCNRPRVLLLDEPTANLDRENARRMEALIRETIRCRQTAALWVSHDLDVFDRVADRRFEWQAGQLEEIQSVSAGPI